MNVKDNGHQQYITLPAVMLIVAGIIVNLVLGALASYFNLPLYLDTIGTMTAAILGGYFPGVIVGFTTNLIRGIFNSSSLYYSALNVLIAFFTTFFYRRKWFKKPLCIIALTLLFIFIGGGLGSLIPWFITGLSSDADVISATILDRGTFGPFASHFIASLILDAPDKVISMILVLVIINVIPKDIRKKVYFGREMDVISPDNTSDIRSRIRVMPLKKKLIIVESVSLLIVSAVAMIIGMNVYNKAVIKERTRVAEDTARISAEFVNGDMVDRYLVFGKDEEGYYETEELLGEVLRDSTEIRYIYVYKIREDGCHVVFDIATQDVAAEELGAVIGFDDEFMKYKDDLLNGRPIPTVISKDRYGHLLTAYEPVYDSFGRVVCYVGVDVDIAQLGAMERSAFTETFSVFLGFFILICVFVGQMTEAHVSLPLYDMTQKVSEFSTSENEQRKLDDFTRDFRNLNVHSGDEVELLYEALCNMILNQTEQVRSIRRLSDSTAKMQDGLIITMADMVENRDSDTGAHIQKTSAYVKIIVEGLKAKGYYSAKVSPKFMSDVVRSAPLHDVGKINIPDEVLNKPGKLTPEEFEIMKTHTTAGKKIIEKAINTVSGDNYLKEARNMAAYHHERWDGKGYPEGLHGEVIPLSARIMAVADVFDALTSPRVYKPAFPLEKALAIIEEGKGTQFDPKCVEVFMEAIPEIKVVLKKYSENT